MPVDRSWKVTVASPMGARISALVSASAGGVLAGTHNEGEERRITEGKIDGAKISWIAATKQPMPMKLRFSGVVDDRQMKGRVQAGFLGAFPFTAVRE